MNDSLKDKLKQLEEFTEKLHKIQQQETAKKQLEIQKEIQQREGFYQHSIRQAEKILSLVKIGEIIHVDDYGKRLFEILDKGKTLNVRVKDVKTGRILNVYATQIQKIEEKPEMVEILYEKDRKV